MINKDSHVRSLLKAINWRIIATMITMLISYLVTGRVKYAVTIGVMEFIAKIAVYYLHERLWQVLPRANKADNQP